MIYKPTPDVEFLGLRNELVIQRLSVQMTQAPSGALVLSKKVSGATPQLSGLHSGPLLSKEALGLMGMPTSVGSPTYQVSREWRSGQWVQGQGTFVSTPIKGLSAQGAGGDTVVGCYGRWVSVVNEEQESLFLHLGLRALLLELKHSGWVTLEFGEDHRFVGLLLSLPPWALYNVLEGCVTGLDTALEGGGRYLPSWTVSLVVSSWPWPLKRGKVTVGPLPEEVEKHFWRVEDDGIYGVVTAWSSAPWGAMKRAERTCRRLGVEEGQWREQSWEGVVRYWESIDHIGT